jgi:hypothetical protein
MQIQWNEAEESSCTGGVRRSGGDNTARLGAGRNVKLWLMESVEEREEEFCSATRRRGTERGEAREVFVLWRAVSRGSRDWDRWRTKLDLSISQYLDEYHRPTTLGTQPKRARFIGSGCFLFCLLLLNRAE